MSYTDEAQRRHARSPDVEGSAAVELGFRCLGKVHTAQNMRVDLELWVYDKVLGLECCSGQVVWMLIARWSASVLEVDYFPAIFDVFGKVGIFEWSATRPLVDH